MVKFQISLLWLAVCPSLSSPRSVLDYFLENSLEYMYSQLADLHNVSDLVRYDRFDHTSTECVLGN